MVRVTTELVVLNVTVTDSSGQYVKGLKASDFKIFEDGKEQEIAYFGTSDKPFTVILLIDTSPSTEYKIEEIRSAAIAFVDQLKPQDRLVLQLLDLEQKTIAEICELTGWNASLVKVRAFRARRKLQKLFQELKRKERT